MSSEYTHDISDVFRLAEKQIELRGADYRYTDEPLYKMKRRCVNVLFDFEDKYTENQKESTYKVRDVNYLDGKRNFRPGCLVGSIILDGTGVDMAWFFQDGRNGATSGSIISDLDLHDLGTFSPLASGFLRELQFNQDKGQTWGEAYSGAMQWVLRTYCPLHKGCGVTEKEAAWIQSVWGDHQGPKEDSAAVSS